MMTRKINAADAPQTVGGYAQAIETTGAQRMLHISGQIPVDVQGQVPDGFDAQARLAWRNLAAQLHAAGMAITDLVKVTIFLSDRRFAAANREVRNEILAGHEVAMTVIITGIFDEAWLLEIEAVAMT